jgi:hypothetical protein
VCYDVCPNDDSEPMSDVISKRFACSETTGVLSNEAPAAVTSDKVEYTSGVSIHHHRSSGAKKHDNKKKSSQIPPGDKHKGPPQTTADSISVVSSSADKNPIGDKSKGSSRTTC